LGFGSWEFRFSKKGRILPESYYAGKEKSFFLGYSQTWHVVSALKKCA
jgi:hypothetical protein